MKIEDQDDPKSIHAGPVSVILVLIKNRSNIHRRLCTKFKGFNNNDSITASILDLLYNQENTDTLTRLIAYLRTYSPSDAEILNHAIKTSQGLSAYNRQRSIEYINHILQGDIDLLTAIYPFIEDTPTMHELMSWYASDLTQQALKKIVPIEPPNSIEQVKLYGMFTTEEDFENYLHTYATNGCYSNYNGTYAYSPYTKQQDCYDRCCNLIPDLSWLRDCGYSMVLRFSKPDGRRQTEETPYRSKHSYGCGIE